MSGLAPKKNNDQFNVFLIYLSTVNLQNIVCVHTFGKIAAKCRSTIILIILLWLEKNKDLKNIA